MFHSNYHVLIILDTAQMYVLKCSILITMY